ncbi:MAG TPA: hypothetical protein VF222_00660 [Nitrososphaeraceae archaeon]
MGSNITQETREFGEKPFALILILIPSVGPQAEEIITVDSANTLVSGKYMREKKRIDNTSEDINTIVK